MSSEVARKYRRGTYYTVSYPTLPNITSKPNSIQIEQKMGRHDIAILEFRTAHETMFKTLKTGVPVKITWNQNGVSRTLHAYVSHVSKESKAQLKSYFQVHCVGSSFPLKKRSTKVYKKKTITDVAREIAKEHGLKFVGENHPRRFDQLAVAGHSQWEWLQEQAQKIGYGVMVDGLNLVVKPIDKLLSQSISNAAVMSMTEPIVPLGAQVFERTLDTFEVLNGENIEQGENLRTIKSVGGVNPMTGRSFTSKKDPKTSGKNIRKNVSDSLFNETVHSQVVNDSVSAKQAAEGKAHLARLNLPATIKGQGDVRLKPWAPICVTGTGKETDGIWVINSVTHFLGSRGTYFVEMLVSTDGLGDSGIAKFKSSGGFSSATPNGTIDVALALSKQNVKSAPNSAALSGRNNKNGTLIESKQGFKRTPTVWKSSNVPARKAR